MLVYVSLMIGVTVTAVLVWRQREELGLKKAYDLVNAGLPNETELVQAAAKQFRQRQAASTIGSWLGGATALIVLAIVHSPIVGLLWSVVAGMFGVAVAVYGVHLRTVRAARREGPRLARLGQRRLRDYLVWPEIAGQYVALVLPVAAVAIGVLVLVDHDDPRIGWTLAGVPVVGLLISAAALVLQRRVLRLSQSAGGESELRWEEAMRAATLRDLGEVIIWSCWLLGGGTAVSVSLPAGMPSFAEPLTLVLFCGGVVVMGMAALASGKWGLRRSQRALG